MNMGVIWLIWSKLDGKIRNESYIKIILMFENVKQLNKYALGFVIMDSTELLPLVLFNEAETWQFSRPDKLVRDLPPGCTTTPATH